MRDREAAVACAALRGERVSRISHRAHARRSARTAPMSSACCKSASSSSTMSDLRRRARRKLENTPIAHAAGDATIEEALLFEDVLSADAKARLQRSRPV